MTLRQLLREYTYKQVFNLIYKLFLKDKGLDRDAVTDVDLSIHALFMRVKNLYVNKNNHLKIYFTQDSDGKIDLLILDEAKDEMLDFHSLGKSDFIDLEIYKAFEIKDLKCLAYILYELYKEECKVKRINLWKPKHSIDDEFQK